MAHYSINICRSAFRTVVSDFICMTTISGKAKMFTGCHPFFIHNKHSFSASHGEKYIVFKHTLPIYLREEYK